MALARPRTVSPAPPPPAGTSVGPCSHWWAERTSTTFTNPYGGGPLPWLLCGYTPAQISSAYGFDRLHASGLDGRGRTIAITGAFFSPTIRADANHFAARFGLPALTGANYRQVVAPGTQRYPRDPSQTQTWYIEQALDVEWAHAIAPAARIVYVGAANDARGLDQALNYTVDNRLADVISNSWGMPESLAPRGEIHATDDVFRQAAAEGIGVYFASGDDGDNVSVTGRASAGFPDSSPWVTSVGGTSLAIGSAGQYLWESGWGTTSTDWSHGRWSPAAPGPFLYGAGGGASHVFDMPGYQAAQVPAADATWKGRLRRTEPDLSMVADPQTGVTFSQTYVLPSGRQKIIDSWIGGTSLSAPLVAGLMTLADQRTGAPHGFINPALYLMRRGGPLRDVTGGHQGIAVLRDALVDGAVVTRLRSFDRDSSLAAAVGWDPVTGMGSPYGPAFIDALG
jgi:subtilase family serine protease